jgi:hypothetical protein
LISLEKFRALLDGDTNTVITKLNSDKGYQLVKSLADVM